MNTNMTGFGWFSKILRSCALEKVASALQVLIVFVCFIRSSRQPRRRRRLSPPAAHRRQGLIVFVCCSDHPGGHAGGVGSLHQQHTEDKD